MFPSIPYPIATPLRLWLKTWRRIHSLLGFKKGYNFILFFILVGALMGFILARFKFLHHPTLLREAIPSDAIYFAFGIRKVGIRIHLFGILIAGFLACFQFVPVIRYKALVFHRMNGYVVIVLFLIAEAGAMMAIPKSAAGDPAALTGLGALAILTTISICLAYYYVKRLRIDLHREWMIRTWVYSGSIISLRLIGLTVGRMIADYPNGPWYTIQRCSDIWRMYALYGVPDEQNPTALKYPFCTGGPDSQARVIVDVAQSAIGPIGPENIATQANWSFGTAMWISLMIHAVGVEIYFRLTPKESERLRKVSGERRIEAGLKPDGKSSASSSSSADVGVDEHKVNQDGTTSSAARKI